MFVPPLYNLLAQTRHFRIAREPAISRPKLSSNNLVECRRGFTIEQRSHLVARFIMGRTVVHCLECGLILEFNYSRVVPSIYRLQKSSAYQATK
jgi:hypothetical protein